MTEDKKPFSGMEAIGLVKSGFRVFPLHTASPAFGCSCSRGKACSRPGKHPIMKGGFHKASDSLLMTMAQFSRWPFANLGIRTGNGVGVLDIDVGKGGFDTIYDLVVRHEELPQSWSVTTGSGGMHIYFKIDREIRNSAGKIGAGVDFRGDGGFAVAPGSHHVSGRSYSWIRGRAPGDLPLAPLPEWLAEICTRPSPFHDRINFGGMDVAEAMSSDMKSIADPARWLFKSVEATLTQIAGAREGTRNQTLYLRSIWAGRLVAGDALPFDDICQELLAAGLQCGLDEDEAHSAIMSGMKFGLSKPRKIFFANESGDATRQFKFSTDVAPEPSPDLLFENANSAFVAPNVADAAKLALI